jgi:hypothetical protein
MNIYQAGNKVKWIGSIERKRASGTIRVIDFGYYPDDDFGARFTKQDIMANDWKVFKPKRKSF